MTHFSIFILSLVLLLACSSCKKDDNPATPDDSLLIMQIDPSESSTGHEVTITGVGFGDLRDSSFVSFNGVQAVSYRSWSNTAIRVTIPVGATSGDVTVHVSSKISKGYAFTIFTVSMTATIDGVPWSATSVSGSSITIIYPVVDIDGISGDDYLKIKINNPVSGKSHTFSDPQSSSLTYALFRSRGTSYWTSSGSGTVNVTSFNNNIGKITGTFEFVGRIAGPSGLPPVNVQNGVFSIKW